MVDMIRVRSKLYTELRNMNYRPYELKIMTFTQTGVGSNIVNLEGIFEDGFMQSYLVKFKAVYNIDTDDIMSFIPDSRELKKV
jgi:hypothetical protein